MKLQLLAFGKLRTPGLRDAVDYYLRNIRPWVEIEEIELKPLSVPDKSPSTRARIQREESELVLKRLSAARGYYLLDETGKPRRTLEWAEQVKAWEIGGGPIGVVIGSSLGFSPELKKQAQGLLSLGPQTLSHELARVVLLEQLYRAWSVTRGHPYHNEGE
jgi:23S rRNA (pseudouridine1915-N3)-methyltransferase